MSDLKPIEPGCRCLFFSRRANIQECIALEEVFPGYEYMAYRAKLPISCVAVRRGWKLDRLVECVDEDGAVWLCAHISDKYLVRIDPDEEIVQEQREAIEA